MKYKLKRHVPNWATVDIQTDFGWFDDIQSAKECGNEHALEFHKPSVIQWHDDDTDDSIWGMCDGWVIFRIYTEQMITEWEARRNYVPTDEERARMSELGAEWIPEEWVTQAWEKVRQANVDEETE